MAKTVYEWLFFNYDDVQKGVEAIHPLRYEELSQEDWENSLRLNYEETLLELIECEPNKETLEETLMLKKENRADSPFYEVYSELNGVEHAIDFRPWSEVLGMSCAFLEQEFLPKHEMIAHLLMEITFDGFSEKEMMQTRQEIMERLDEHFSDES